MKNWRLALISANDEIFSSDNPSLFFAVKNELSLVLLPITPQYYLAAYDQRKFAIISDKMTENDLGRLNSIQAKNCIEYVYTNIKLTDDLGHGKPLNKWLNDPRPPGYVKNTHWLPNYFIFNREPFSFIEER